MFVTSFQGHAFLICAGVGVLLGLAYELLYIVRFCFKEGIIATIFCDILFGAAALGAGVWSFYNFLLEFRLYVFLGFTIGFILEHFSMGYLIAKTAKFVYNGMVRLKRNLVKRSRVFKRLFR